MYCGIQFDWIYKFPIHPLDPPFIHVLEYNFLIITNNNNGSFGEQL